MTCAHEASHGALSDFDGDFLPDFGTEDSPADYCARNSSLSPIALKIGLKVAGASSVPNSGAKSPSKSESARYIYYVYTQINMYTPYLLREEKMSTVFY